MAEKRKRRRSRKEAESGRMPWGCIPLFLIVPVAALVVFFYYYPERKSTTRPKPSSSRPAPAKITKPAPGPKSDTKEGKVINAEAVLQATLARIKQEPGLSDAIIHDPEPSDSSFGKTFLLKIGLHRDTQAVAAEKLIQEFWAAQYPGLDVDVAYPEEYGRGSVMLMASKSGNPLLNVVLLKEQDKLASKPLPPAGKKEHRGNGTGRLAIVIDDMGENLEKARELAGLELPVTFAIMPFRRYSKDVEDIAVQAGHQVIVHMPMQPVEYPANNPGEGALLLTMTPEQIKDKLNQALDGLPHAAGINNHMGSALTQDSERMNAVMSVLAQRHLFFLDSRTSTRTIGFDEAHRDGVAACERGMFLDNVEQQSTVENEIHAAVKKAINEGSLIAIGHIRPDTIHALRNSASWIKQQPVTLVYAGELCQ